MSLEKSQRAFINHISLCAQPSAADVIIAELNEDHFTLEPGSRDLKCLVDRVAAHSLYEQTNPLYIYEPEGVADLRESEYEQVTDRMVKVSKSRFKTADKKTIKIEGAKCVGYRTICIGGSNEPKYIDRLDEIFSLIRKYVESNLPNSADSSDYSLDFKLYGGAEGICTPSAQAGIVIDAVAKTQDLANFVCGKARAALLHTDYPGRKTTAGNIAFPYSPSDLPLGPVYEFSAYHLIEVDNFSEVYQVEYKQVGI